MASIRSHLPLQTGDDLLACPSMSRTFWMIAGLLALATGAAGIFLPLLPTVPLFILAAFCFSRSNRAWEARLLDHPRFGPPIRAWREHGRVSRNAKLAATGAFAASIALGAITLPFPWILLPPLCACLCLAWLWTRPEG